MSAIENALGKLSSADQCTPVVLNYSCCGVAGVVLGLNWSRELEIFVSLPYPRLRFRPGLGVLPWPTPWA